MSQVNSLIGSFFTLCVLYILFGSSSMTKAVVFTLMFVAGTFEVLLYLHSPLLVGWAIRKG